LVQRGRDLAGPSPPRLLLAVPNITAHPSTAGVPITVLLYNGPLLCGFNVDINGLNDCVILFLEIRQKKNEEILQMVETEREIMDTVRSRLKRWLGHILRHDSLLRIMLEGRIQGKKVHRRPRTFLGLAPEDGGREL